MDLRQIRYFIAIAESGSLSEAARRLHIVQPALSQRLAALEADLGVQLLVRGRSGIALTPSGAELYQRALLIAKHIDTARLAVKEKAGEVEGAITIGVLRSMAPAVGKRLFLTLKEQLPRVTPHLRTGYSAELGKMLQEGRVDLAMQVLPAGSKPETGILYSEHLYAVGVPALLGTGNHPIALAELQGIPILTAARQSSHELLVQAAHRQHIPLDVIGDVEDSFSLLEICDTGIAATFLSGAMAHEAARHRGLTVRPLDDPRVVRHVTLAVNPDVPRTAALIAAGEIVGRVLMERMREAMGDGG